MNIDLELVSNKYNFGENLLTIFYSNYSQFDNFFEKIQSVTLPTKIKSDVLLAMQYSLKKEISNFSQKFYTAKVVTISQKKSEKSFYLDVYNYLAAGTSLEKFYAAYNVKFPKGHFPYQWFDWLENLEYTELPPPNEFYSHLTK